MKISSSWLRQYYDAGLSTEEIARVLTDTGLEVGGVESFETVPGGLQGLVIGEVLTCDKHPNADRLSVTTVNVGEAEPLQIVCGAPNVAAGQKVVVATVGTTLYPSEGEPFQIKKGRIRGEVSNGMICAEDEIGMGASHEGIMVLDKDAPTGTAASSYFNMESDQVMEIDLTPNRSDAISHIGVARDLLAALKAQGSVKADEQLRWPDVSGFKVDDRSRSIQVEVEDPEACPRYSGITVSGVEVKASPDWLQQRLKSIGLKPLNNIVDITNFILHEMGQPLHAFDADKISGDKVIVKKLRENTEFITLDEEKRKLSKDDLMICNEKEGMCIAGVFGGISSGVTANTTSVFIESAYFHPVGIRKTARRHGLNTDASFRYERGTDPHITVYALKRAAMLIKEVAGGRISSEIVDVYPKPVGNAIVAFSFDRCDRLIGQHIEKGEVKAILQSLDIEIVEDNGDSLQLSIPTYRVDVKREADVIEEILRIYGYNRIDLPEKLRSALTYSQDTRHEQLQQLIATHLSANGFTEIMSNSLTRSTYYKDEEESLVKVLNPLSSELKALRQSLLFGALEAVLYNQNRKTGNIRFFEFGKTYSRGEKGYEENKRLLLLLSGKLREENWNHPEEAVDFYELKKYVWMVLDRMGIDRYALTIEEAIPQQMEYGLQYRSGNKRLLLIGKLKQKLNKEFDITAPVFYADLNWDQLLRLAAKEEVVYRPVPRFPAVRRDLALLLDQHVKFEELEQIALKSERKLLKSVHLFDVYEGKGLPEGKKSYAVSFLFRSDDKTLQDKQVDDAVKRIYKALNTSAGASLRQGEI